MPLIFITPLDEVGVIAKYYYIPKDPYEPYDDGAARHLRYSVTVCAPPPQRDKP